MIARPQCLRNLCRILRTEIWAETRRRAQKSMLRTEIWAEIRRRIKKQQQLSVKVAAAF